MRRLVFQLIPSSYLRTTIGLKSTKLAETH